MGKSPENQYRPDSVSPPGETLIDTIGALGMSLGELAKRTGRSEAMIHAIIEAKAPISIQMALALERALGVPANFWINREHHFRQSKTRSDSG